MANKEFSKKLKDLRLKAGYSQKEVYEHFRIPQSTFSSWEVGKSEPPGDMLVKLCEFYKCDMINDLSDGRNDNITYLEWNIIEKYRQLDSHGKEMVDFTLLKEWERSTADQKQKDNSALQTSVSADSARIINYYYRLASAGTGQIVFDMPPTKRIAIPNIPEYKRVDYAIGVNGNSMEPVYHDGDTLLVEMTDEIDPGDIGIFLVDNESYVKKLGDGNLISLNPEYHDIPLTEESLCMGRVVSKF